MKRTRSPIRVAAVAIALLPSWLVLPAAAQGVIATGSGRAGATVAGVVALIGAVIGGMALSRAARRIGNHGRDGAIVATVLGLIGVALGRLALARSRPAG